MSIASPLQTAGLVSPATKAAANTVHASSASLQSGKTVEGVVDRVHSLSESDRRLLQEKHPGFKAAQGKSQVAWEKLLSDPKLILAEVNINAQKIPALTNLPLKAGQTIQAEVRPDGQLQIAQPSTRNTEAQLKALATQLKAALNAPPTAAQKQKGAQPPTDIQRLQTSSGQQSTITPLLNQLHKQLKSNLALNSMPQGNKRAHPPLTAQSANNHLSKLPQTQAASYKTIVALKAQESLTSQRLNRPQQHFLQSLITRQINQHLPKAEKTAELFTTIQQTLKQLASLDSSSQNKALPKAVRLALERVQAHATNISSENKYNPTEAIKAAIKSANQTLHAAHAKPANVDSSELKQTPTLKESMVSERPNLRADLQQLKETLNTSLFTTNQQALPNNLSPLLPNGQTGLDALMQILLKNKALDQKTKFRLLQDSTLKTLKKSVEQTLARMQLLQFQSLNQKLLDTTQNLTNIQLELPLRFNESYINLFLQLEEHAYFDRDNHENTEQEEKQTQSEPKTQWRVVMEFDFEHGSKLTTEIKLTDDRIKTTLWTDNQKLERIVQARMHTLNDRLVSAGLEVEGLECANQLTMPKQSLGLSYSLIDVST